MLGYAFKRVLSAIPIVLITITACFFILRLAPGGPFDGERALPPDMIRNLRAYYHLDDPIFIQYLNYLGGVMHGDFGPSMVMKDFSVSRLLSIGLPFTLMLGFTAFIVGTAAGLIAGALAAVNQNKMPDYVLVFLVLIPLIIPNFLMANLVQLAFGVYLGWLPVGGYQPGAWTHLVLPVIILAMPHGARVARLMRGSMIEVLGTNYIRTARSKGLGTRLILARHAIKPAMIPVVSYLGPGLSYLLTGSLVVEQVFTLPGIGKYFITAALNRDYGVVLGTTVIYIFIILVLNLIVDMIYAWLDPKVRLR
jgi:oligopeptide transport system permease protein